MCPITDAATSEMHRTAGDASHLSHFTCHLEILFLMEKYKKSPLYMAKLSFTVFGQRWGGKKKGKIQHGSVRSWPGPQTKFSTFQPTAFSLQPTPLPSSFSIHFPLDTTAQLGISHQVPLQSPTSQVDQKIFQDKYYITVVALHTTETIMPGSYGDAR